MQFLLRQDGTTTSSRTSVKRYRGLFHPLWPPAMVFLINFYFDRYFR